MPVSHTFDVINEPLTTFSLQDIDECAAQTNPCGDHECVNKPGDFNCKCKDGYKNVDDECVGEYISQMLIMLNE